VLVIGAGPAGLEFSRVASGQGNSVVVYEREHAVGGHVRAYGALPYRQQYGSMATWLAEQARGNGTEIKLSSPVTRENIDSFLPQKNPIMLWSRLEHITAATVFRGRWADRFQAGKQANVFRGTT
jgi:pyruvate/2-oxoglutarate dehydrogenase complex dihydrolipoamide dehydrogenase (E3) component